MKKVFLFIFVLLGLFVLGGFKVSASDKDIYYIVTTVGEDASTEMTINWHCEDEGSYVLLTTSDDKAFLNATKYEPTHEKLWSTEFDYNADLTDTFSTHRRYVCNLELHDLTPRTKYIYKVVYKETESNVFHFTTAGLTNNWSFVAFCDYQNPGNTVTHKLMESMYKLADSPSLVLCSGDLTGAGGTEGDWQWFFNSDVFTKFIHMASPGDHEYWAVDSGSPIPMLKAPVVYNNLFDNPKNGCPSSLNSSYYFYYNNVLFIALDMNDSNTASSTRLDEQAKWLDETLAKLEGTYQFSVIFEHKSLYGSTIEDSSVAKKIRPQYTPIIDKYNVDLVISGHDHEFSRSAQIYDGKVSDNKLQGTYYLDMGSSGNKRRALDNSTVEDGLHEKVIDLKTTGQSFGASITVRDDKMIVQVYDQNEVLCDSFVINTKRPKKDVSSSDFNKEKFESDITIEPLDVENKKAVLKFNDSSELKYIDAIDVVSKRTVLSTNLSFNNILDEYELNGVTSNSLTIKLTLLDGTKVEFDKTLEVGEIKDFRLATDNGIYLTWDGEITGFGTNEFVLVTNGASRDLTSEEISNKKIVLDETIYNSDKEYKLIASNNGEVVSELVVNVEKKYTVKFLVDGVVVKEDRLNKGESAIAPADPTKEGFEFKGWDKDFTNVTSDLEVNAKFEEIKKVKEYTVKFFNGDTLLKEEKVLEGGSAIAPADPVKEGYEFNGWDKDFTNVVSDLEIHAKFTEIIVEPSKSGCQSGAIQMVSSLIALFGLAIVFKKRFN